MKTPPSETGPSGARSSTTSSAPADRHDRSAAALRANLARRKVQSRARSGHTDSTAESRDGGQDTIPPEERGDNARWP
ncbi:hypothetical protein [uncultured Rhodospira sp.]|uniref:hypothetical protein n=1 Tax=uncultured Rhodospira sp. TaxID=1936189 RepID=UPI0026326F66|nr:hypothetical protein [uncultured Rhodospira sp.]